MSGDLNPRQFEQLPMFVPTQEIVEQYHKGDAVDSGDDPEMQWTGGIDDEGHWNENLRDLKWAELFQTPYGEEKSRAQYFMEQRKQQALPPVTVRKTPEGNLLNDGHHRLAYAERQGMEFLPVRHAPEWRYL